MTEGVSDRRSESLAMIVGLGNPGKEYALHRHNVGFMVVDALAQAHGLRFTRNRGANAWVAQGQIQNRAVLLAKPRTFMNLSGRAVHRLRQAHQVSPEQILVVCDDLDLPLGRLRMRPAGGSGGHKGMQSIIDSLGTHSFPRLRVGIDRPSGSMDPADYVLQPFDAAQRPLLLEAIQWAVAAIECWLAEGMAAAMDRFNRAVHHPSAGEET